MANFQRRTSAAISSGFTADPGAVHRHSGWYGTAPARLQAMALGAITVLLLASCTTRQPAPIVHRAPVGSAPTAGRPAALPLPSIARNDGVQVTPIGPGRGEQRPLAGDSGAVRSQPDGLKRPYSEEALARARGQAMPPVATASPSSTAPVPLPLPSAGAAKPAAAPASRDVSSQGFIWPSGGQVIQRFAESRSKGLSIAGSAGDPVVAASAGRVIFSGKGPRGYGNLVIIKHPNDLLSVYGHNQRLLVKEGTNVQRGQRIAELGATDADRPKLHFEIRKDSQPVDPSTYLPAR